MNLAKSINTSNEEILRSMIEEIATLKDNKAGGRQYMHEDCLFIRPTGNPLTMTQWDAMMNSPYVNMTASSLLAINKLEVEGNMAYACYTTHSQFNYKGIDNDDIAVFTGIFRKNNGKWMMVHGQRSTGRTPDEELPQF
jgi:ketosteroid isomerase-like protein